ncbi:T9SS type A sorting domain-containing protein [Paenimyroides baculatum]|uniref:T9SS type A sorting domain-containing protein n=1 Tax=Paenimyroides baculatum TaxID=2608000 RepID=A0A5M6CZC3_9FLAO|nr:T9SS type A sorting domain-containing protein [Paenimyroides baculatum]KAA5538195.1 T9SS type A sorting domain-containing protein [Paenimyroides baculatum]
MQNGTGLAGNDSSQQLAIVKDPSNSNKYYVFTTAMALSNPPTSFIAYTIIDMSLGPIGSNGLNLGAVVPASKNIPVLDPGGNIMQTEAITALPHADGSSYWILIPNGNYLYSYLLDSNGLSSTPVANSLNYVFNYVGSIRVSPKINTNLNFTHLISINRWSTYTGNNVFSFNNATGNITNDYFININSVNTFSSEFNKDGSILYLCGYGLNKLFAIDIANSQSSLIINTIYTGSNAFNSPTMIQRNMHNDIYAIIGSGNYLGKIINPDIYGSSYLDISNTYLNGKNGRLGLPQLIPLHNNCIPDITLSAPETNTNYVYQVGNNITTQLNYNTNNKNIIMNAGNSITLLPDTEITAGSSYLAAIKKCPAMKPSTTRFPLQIVELYYDLDKEENYQNSLVNNMISVYPNPTTSQFTINNQNNELEKWELFDLSGKLVSQGNTIFGSIENLTSATYVLKVHLKNKTVNSIKLIKK